MKSKELIRILQSLDPTGEEEVVTGEGDIYFLDSVEAYWDGSLNVLIRDPAKAPYYDIIGMREIRSGGKIRIHSMGLYDIVENGPNSKFEDLILEGRPEFIDRARKYYNEIQEIYHRVDSDEFHKFCVEKLDFQDPEKSKDFFKGNPNLARPYKMGRSIKDQQNDYWTECVRIYKGNLTYFTGFEEKDYGKRD